jgi:hypothetical protein
MKCATCGSEDVVECRYYCEGCVMDNICIMCRFSVARDSLYCKRCQQFIDAAKEYNAMARTNFVHFIACVNNNWNLDTNASINIAIIESVLPTQDGEKTQIHMNQGRVYIVNLPMDEVIKKIERANVN